jgi:hypothetical protein
MANSYPRRCDCCEALVHTGVWDIAEPGAAKSWAICRVCAGHVALKADGKLWVPPDCPCPPTARLRVLSPADALDR